MTARRRRPVEPVSAERIATAAIALADVEGLPALSMRRVGAALGVEAMSLYHHLPSKAALLDAVVDQLASGLPTLEPGEGWRATLSAAARAWLQLARRHPGAFPILALRALGRPALLDWYAAILRTLREAGLRPLEAARGTTSFFTGLDGFLLAAGRPVLFPELDEPGARPRRAPRRVARARLRAVPAHAWELTRDAYAAHVEVLLDGLAARIERSAGGEGRRGAARAQNQGRRP